jgi:hypothetical protein
MYRCQFGVVVRNVYTEVSVKGVGFQEKEIVEGESLPELV